MREVEVTAGDNESIYKFDLHSTGSGIIMKRVNIAINFARNNLKIILKVFFLSYNLSVTRGYRYIIDTFLELIKRLAKCLK